MACNGKCETLRLLQPTVQGETEYQWDADWAVVPEPQLGKVKQIGEEGEAWAPTPFYFYFFFWATPIEDISQDYPLFFLFFFFSCGPGGCPLPWLFNIPPAKTKGSRQQTSALLNGSKANLDPWIRTANQDRSEMQIKLRINQEAIRKCKSQRKAEVWLQACHYMMQRWTVKGDGWFARFQKHKWEAIPNARRAQEANIV